jgi:hypothetical protein
MSTHGTHPPDGSTHLHRDAGLHVCRRCEEPFVVPVALHEVVGDRFVVELTCNNCGWGDVGLHDDQALDALDRELDRSLAAMVATAELHALADELEAIDRFVAALRADRILPEDF